MANQPKEQPAETPAARQPKLSELVRQAVKGAKKDEIAPGAAKEATLDEITDALAGEFEKTNLTLEKIDNAPLKIRRTYGVDLYKLIKLIKSKAGGS